MGLGGRLRRRLPFVYRRGLFFFLKLLLLMLLPLFLVLLLLLMPFLFFLLAHGARKEDGGASLGALGLFRFGRGAPLACLAFISHRHHEWRKRHCYKSSRFIVRPPAKLDFCMERPQTTRQTIRRI